MVAKNLFRSRTVVSRNDTFKEETEKASTPCEQKLVEYEEQLTHLTQQKELHTLALKEMYQFLCKLDTSFKEENQKLRDLIDLEQSRSTKLIEVTKGLWDIIELMDDGRPGPVERAAELTREVEELSQLEVEISDESGDLMPTNFPMIEDIAPMMAIIDQ